MQWTLRLRLLAVAAAFGFASILSMATSSWIEQRATARVEEIQQRLIPHLEFGMRVEALFEELARQMQAAVAARDEDLLESATDVGEQLAVALNAARSVVDEDLLERERRAVSAYSEAAQGVARSLIANETGEELVQRMKEMKVLQDQARGLLAQARLDKDELNAAFESARATQKTAGDLRLAINITFLALAVALALVFSRGIVRNMAEVSSGLRRFAAGHFDEPILTVTSDEVGSIARQANSMARGLAQLSAERDRHDWIRSGTTGLLLSVRGELSTPATAQRALGFLTGHLGAAAGAIYHRVDDKLKLVAAAGISTRGHARSLEFDFGDGLVGRVAASAEFTVLDSVPRDYFRIESALGGADPSLIVLAPICRAERVVGVIELALFGPFEERTRELLQACSETVAIALEVAASREQAQQLLEETRAQAARLTAQEEELRANNEELEAQHDDVRRANDELAAQRSTLQERNAELEAARESLEQTAGELELASNHKSRFLANMSHELRTPLNSMLLLSGLLADQQAGALTEAQVAHCRTIHQSGQALLALINDLLDLAKIEAGMQEVELQATEFETLSAHASHVLGPLAREKGLGFDVTIDPALPATLVTDARRLKQIVTNLLSNAIKFTESGRVGLEFKLLNSQRGGTPPGGTLELVVTDTGVGIPESQQSEVFDAFHRAQSTKSIVGTGLGLAIVRELTTLLGGEVVLRSAPGEGSVFTVYLPLGGPTQVVSRSSAVFSVRAESGAGAAVRPERSKRDTDGDHRRAEDGSPTLLVIEDEPVFASQLASLIQERGFGVAVAHTGQAGLNLAERIAPCGILLDLKLPDIDGFAVLDRLKANELTRDIPVHVISAMDAPSRAVESGAIGYLGKPATHQQLIDVIERLHPVQMGIPPSTILVVQGDRAKAVQLTQFLNGAGVESAHHTDQNRATALATPEQVRVLDVRTMGDAMQLLRTLRAEAPQAAVVLHAAQPLNREELRDASQLARAVVVDEGDSAERLLQELRLFLRHVTDHRRRRVGADPSPPPNGAYANVRLEGKQILLTDDDMRTVYAVSALLRGRGAGVVVAETGLVALQALRDSQSRIDCILMDIMMPEMDGFEAIAAIREQSQFDGVPIIALTAKAMASDREKCLALGANEYLPKPVDGALLLDCIARCLAETERERTVA